MFKKKRGRTIVSDDPDIRKRMRGSSMEPEDSSYSVRKEIIPMDIEHAESSDNSDDEGSEGSSERAWRHEKGPSSSKRNLIDERPLSSIKSSSVGDSSVFQSHPDKGNDKEEEPNDLISDILREIEDEEECMYFARGLCNRGSNCRFIHRQPDLGTLVQRQLWKKFCKDYPMSCNDNRKCNKLHVSKQDEMCYLYDAAISEHVLRQALRKVLVLDIPLNEKYVCKKRLDSVCSIQNCTFLHISKLEFIYYVIAELKKEFMSALGPCLCFYPGEEEQQAIISATLASKAGDVPDPVSLPSLVDRVAIEGKSAAELQQDVKQLAQESANYAEYIVALKEENELILNFLNPFQSGNSLEDMQRNMFVLFETIRTKSSVTAVAQSHGIKSGVLNLKPLPQYNNSFSQNDAVVPESETQLPVEAPPEEPDVKKKRKPRKSSAKDDEEEERFVWKVVEAPKKDKPLEIPRTVFTEDQLLHMKELFGSYLKEVGIDREEPIIESESDSEEEEVPVVPKKKKKLKVKPDKRRLIVYNLSNAHDEEALRQYFTHFGKILRILFKAFFVFIKYENAGSAQAALDQGKYHEVNGFTLCILEDQGRVMFGYGDEVMPEMDNSLLIKGLTHVHTEKHLEEYFFQFGRPIRFLTKSNYAQITYPDAETGEKLINQTEPHIINGRRVIVKKSNLRSLANSQQKWARRGKEVVMCEEPSEKVYISGLNNTITEAELEEYFAKFGKVQEIIIRNKTEDVRVYGYVTFAELQSAIDAVNCDEHEVKDIPIRLEYIKSFFRDDDEAKDSDDVVPVKKDDIFLEPLFIGCLSKELDRCDLEDYFSKFGTIYKLQVKCNKYGVTRGFGFVTYCDREVAERVATMDNHQIKDYPCIVKFADPKYFRKPNKDFEEKKTNLQEEEPIDFDDDPDIMQAKELGLMEELDGKEQEQGEEEEEKSEKTEPAKDKKEEQEKDQPKESQIEEKETPAPPSKLYVGGLNKTVKDEDLLQYFSAFGAVQIVDVKRNKKGVCRGFGFITFANNQIAADAASSTHHEINGNIVMVRYADPHLAKNSKRFVQGEQIPLKNLHEKEEGTEDNTSESYIAMES